ncbi:MAG: DUF1653 domain-containing protein [Asticcacaulis sp.]
MLLTTSFYKSDLPRGLYRHYKNKLYRVYGTVTHSETEEVQVLYAPVDQTAGEARLWVRPLAMFVETVAVDGVVVPRFALIDTETDQPS